jgi:hypothetical protein
MDANSSGRSNFDSPVIAQVIAVLDDFAPSLGETKWQGLSLPNAKRFSGLKMGEHVNLPTFLGSQARRSQSGTFTS